MKDAAPAYSVYIVQCADETLYCGIALDVGARVAQHNFGKLGARYTKARRPVQLVYEEVSGTRSDAQRREWQIKKLARAEKDRLIREGQRLAADDPEAALLD